MQNQRRMVGQRRVAVVIVSIAGAIGGAACSNNDSTIEVVDSGTVDSSYTYYSDIDDSGTYESSYTYDSGYSDETSYTDYSLTDEVSYTDESSASDSGYTTDSGPPTEDRDGVQAILADGVSRPLVAPCFVSSSLVIPEEWEFLIAPEGCNFVFQGPSADVAAIAGELFISSSGRSFEELRDSMIADIEAGTEPDIRFLSILNSKRTDGPLTITNRWDSDSDSIERWTIVEHDTNRFGSTYTYSAIIDAPTSADGATNVIMIWANFTPDGQDFFFDFVEGLTTFNLG